MGKLDHRKVGEMFMMSFGKAGRRCVKVVKGTGRFRERKTVRIVKTHLCK